MLVKDDISSYAATCKQEFESSRSMIVNLAQHYPEIARCIAVKAGLIVNDASGEISNDELTQRINATDQDSVGSEEEREYFLKLVPKCVYWERCMREYCNTQ